MKTNFQNVVKATGKSFEIEQSISGYYRLMLDCRPIIDDSACEDLNGTLEDAELVFMDYLLEHEVPKDKKELKEGMWFLK